ncbi:MAG: creatininase family protein [Planctomycetota bacterium]
MDLTDLKWTDVDSLSRDTPIVIPVAALEQHGRHMPLFTDSLLLGEVVRRVKEHKAVADRTLFAPLQWLGNSEHHLDFPGTMTASPRLYLDLLRDMAENFLFHGFRRILVLNGHGGNIIPAQQAFFELRQKYRQRGDLCLLTTTYWTLGGQPHKVDPLIKQQQMGHACEWETSMMLRIQPHLVGDLSKTEPVEFGSGFAPAHRAWITKDRTAPGHIGDPRFATAEKGETIFRVFTADVVALLERMLAWDGTAWDA